MLVRTRAGLDDAIEFETFACWDRDPALAWVNEVENYIRGGLLWRFANITLAFRDNGELVARRVRKFGHCGFAGRSCCRGGRAWATRPA